MKDILKKSKVEIEKDIADKREALRAWKFSVVGSKVKNMREGRTMRRDIARMMTALKVKSVETK